MEPKLSKEYIEFAYTTENLSFREIAGKLGVYPNKIRRFATKNGIPIRTKSEAQKMALSSGRHTHPTAGTHRSEEVKAKISDKMAENWVNLTDEEYDERVQMGRDAWENLSQFEKEQLKKKAGDAIRKTSRDGSKMEHAIKDALTNAGYVVEFHKEGLIPNMKLQIDMFLPEFSTAIEVDGPSHFMPIWGEKNFLRNKKADQEKSGLITSYGMTLVRVKCTTKSISGKTIRDAIRGVLEAVEDIKTNDRRTHVIEFEV